MRSIRVSLLPPFGATLEEPEFRHQGRSDVPPLIAIRRASPRGNRRVVPIAKRVREVTLEGLQIHIPPRGEQRAEDVRARGRPERQPRSPFVIASIVADGTSFRAPRKSGKQPLEFDIRRLRLHSVGIDRPMEFDAELRNAKPPGIIRSHGRFGPWAARDPGDTAVSGDYTFQDADLSVFRGIAGILSSQGSYSGKLERIEVQGATDTPGFRVSGHPVHLKTEFSATVDGTDGDTYLHPVTAHFLRSTVVANGSVAGTPGVKGKTVALDATVEQGRIEDVLRLAVKSDKPALTGGIGFRSKIVIPPGDADVIDKLYLNGTFGVGSGRFTHTGTQKKIATAEPARAGRHRRSRGESVASNFTGAFCCERPSFLATALPSACRDLTRRLTAWAAGDRTSRRGEDGCLGVRVKTGVKSFFLS